MELNLVLALSILGSILVIGVVLIAVLSFSLLIGGILILKAKNPKAKDTILNKSNTLSKGLDHVVHIVKYVIIAVVACILVAYFYNVDIDKIFTNMSIFQFLH